MRTSQPRMRRRAIAALKARDPNTLTLEEGYELYRDELARELEAANDDFHGMRRAVPPDALIACGGALLLAATITAAALLIDRRLSRRRV